MLFFEIAYLPLQLLNLLRLLRIQSVDDSFLSLSPNLIQFVQQQLKLWLSQFTLPLPQELLPKRVNLLREPKSTLRDEVLIACAEMQNHSLRLIQMSLDLLVNRMQESNPVVLQGQISELLVLGGCLKHF